MTRATRRLGRSSTAPSGRSRPRQGAHRPVTSDAGRYNRRVPGARLRACAAERLFVSSLSPNPALPREFEHPALQELVMVGRTHGTVDAEAFRAACESAEVNDAKRLKVVYRGLAAAGVTVAEPVVGTAKVAAATTTARKGASASVDAGAAAPAKRRAPAKKAAVAGDAEGAAAAAP